MKAILIIEKPEHCVDCPLLDKEYCICVITNGYIDRRIRKEDIREFPCPLKPIPNKLDNLDLELWNSLEGSIVAPKGMFDEIYNSGYEDGQKDSLSNIENLTEKAFKDGFEEGRKR